MQVGVCNMCPHTPTRELVVYFLFLIAIHSFFHSSIQQILRTYCIMLVATPAMEPLLSDTFNKSCHKAVGTYANGSSPSPIPYWAWAPFPFLTATPPLSPFEGGLLGNVARTWLSASPICFHICKGPQKTWIPGT